MSSEAVFKGYAQEAKRHGEAFQRSIAQIEEGNQFPLTCANVAAHHYYIMCCNIDEMEKINRAATLWIAKLPNEIHYAGTPELFAAILRADFEEPKPKEDFYTWRLHRAGRP